MHTKYLFLILLSSVLLSSCLAALYPLSFDEKDFVFKPELIGVWGDPTDTSEYFIADTAKGTGGRLYKITEMNYDDSGALEKKEWLAQLINLKGTYFMDIWLDDRFRMQQREFDSTGMYIREHFFLKLQFKNTDLVELFFPDDDSVTRRIDRHQISLKYIKMGKEGGHLLLDKPDILQKAFVKMEKYPGFYDKIEFIRLRSIAQQSSSLQKEGSN